MNGDRLYAGWKEEVDRILKQHDHAHGNGHPPKYSDKPLPRPFTTPVKKKK